MGHVGHETDVAKYSRDGNGTREFIEIKNCTDTKDENEEEEEGGIEILRFRQRMERERRRERIRREKREERIERERERSEESLSARSPVEVVLSIAACDAILQLFVVQDGRPVHRTRDKKLPIPRAIHPPPQPLVHRPHLNLPLLHKTPYGHKMTHQESETMER